MSRDGEFRRPSPDEFLRRIEAEKRLERKGKLKVFLGYASGSTMTSMPSCFAGAADIGGQ